MSLIDVFEGTRHGSEPWNSDNDQQGNVQTLSSQKMVRIPTSKVGNRQSLNRLAQFKSIDVMIVATYAKYVVLCMEHPGLPCNDVNALGPNRLIYIV